MNPSKNADETLYSDGDPEIMIEDSRDDGDESFQPMEIVLNDDDDGPLKYQHSMYSQPRRTLTIVLLIGLVCGFGIGWGARGAADKKDFSLQVSSAVSDDGNNCVSSTPTAPTNNSSASPTDDPAGTNLCGCETCTQQVWDSPADDYNGNFSCGSRIEWLQSENGLTEFDACVRVSGAEFPKGPCGPNCNPYLCDNPETVEHPDRSKLIWSDEFDEDGLPNPSHWTYDVGGNGWGNNELQFYADSRLANSYVEDGILHIRAFRDDYNGKAYSSARIVSKNLADFMYGRIRVKARLARCQGLGTWPAIWMLPTDWAYGEWPNSGEIDIMEHVGYDNGVVHGSIHTKAYNHMIGTQESSSIYTEISKWHVYEIIWTETYIQFLMDGLIYFEVEKKKQDTFAEWPFDKDFHLLLNIAVGGDWGGAQGVNITAFEGDGQTMEIDWVRVYEL